MKETIINISAVNQLKKLNIAKHIPIQINFYLMVLTIVLTIAFFSTIFNYIDSRHELTIQSINYNSQINQLQDDNIELEYMLEECNMMHTPAEEGN